MTTLYTYAEYLWQPPTLKSPLSLSMAVSDISTGERECIEKHGHLPGYQFLRTVVLDGEGNIEAYSGLMPLSLCALTMELADAAKTGAAKYFSTLETLGG